MKDKLKGEKLSSPNTLTGAAMLVALYTILSFFTLKLSTTWEIGFAYLALAVCGMLYGPVAAGIAGALGDTLGFIVSPNGGFFIGFTLSAFIMGFLYGIVLYKRPVTLKRVIVATLIVTLVCNLTLTPLWLKMMYGTNLIAAPRIIRNVVLYPVHTALLYSVLKGVSSFRKSGKAV
ncbi:MAG: folate family ECF transporter S component [Clostridiales bacterium]|nr:folate family ECF transporter S component [Clostridiales bacterium]